MWVRLLASAAATRATTQRDRTLAQGQLRDYTARLGAPFEHAVYLEALDGSAGPSRSRRRFPGDHPPCAVLAHTAVLYQVIDEWITAERAKNEST